MNPTIKQQIAEAQAKLAELKAKIVSVSLPNLGKSIKVSIGEEKGNILIYGLQRFPYCFYPNQLAKMREVLNSQEVIDFIEANKDKLSTDKQA